MAGIIAGSGKASQGTCMGIAPGCHLIGLKVLDAAGNGMQHSTIRALEWLLEYYRQYQIRVVNISVGSTIKNYRQQDALIRAVDESGMRGWWW